ncbi:hypothetical protein ACFV80_15365 [Streptomyces sp. NPDC059862]|uniref:hypothetical protein n=1 Tax=Streptomyces sp. NPDC059862 TaxID=3346975 RepID=UPI00365E34A2
MKDAQSPTRRPFLDFRLGGIHLKIERFPWWLTLLITNAASALGGNMWLGQ